MNVGRPGKHSKYAHKSESVESRMNKFCRMKLMKGEILLLISEEQEQI